MSTTFRHDVRQLAYSQTQGAGPGIVFLGGYNSDMEGTKARYLEEWARARGRAFLRFDYSGHGRSSGAFTDGTIGDWAEDAAAIIDGLTEGPQLLVGSSMGGWISLLLAREMPGRVGGLVTIAAAPDFTERLSETLNAEDRERLERDGYIERKSAYSDGPYMFTRKLIEDGRDRRVLDRPLRLSCPVRLLHGTADTDVDPSVGIALLQHLEADDAQLTLVKNADHRFSDGECLGLIVSCIDEVTARM